MSLQHQGKRTTLQRCLREHQTDKHNRSESKQPQRQAQPQTERGTTQEGRTYNGGATQGTNDDRDRNAQNNNPERSRQARHSKDIAPGEATRRRATEPSVTRSAETAARNATANGPADSSTARRAKDSHDKNFYASTAEHRARARARAKMRQEAQTLDSDDERSSAAQRKTDKSQRVLRPTDSARTVDSRDI